MGRKWATCSTAGILCFNNELVSMPRALGDSIIVYELLRPQAREALEDPHACTPGAVWELWLFWRS